MLRVCRRTTGSLSFARGGTVKCRRKTIASNTIRCPDGPVNKSPLLLVSKNSIIRSIHMDCIMMNKTRISRNSSGFLIINSQHQRCSSFSTTSVVDDSTSSTSSSYSMHDISEQQYPQQQQQLQKQLQEENEQQTHVVGPSHKEIIKFANDVVWHTSPHKHCPLGSMTSDLWDDSITAIAYCLQQPQSNHDNDHDDNEFLVLQQVDAADRIMNRLIQEHATQSMTSRSWTSTLEYWKIPLFQAWLHVVDILTIHNETTAQYLALERAEKLWKKIHRHGAILQKQHDFRAVEVVVGKDNKVVDDNNNLALNEFVNLIQAWLRINTLLGTERVIQLLLWDEIPNLFQNRQKAALIACYHEALQQYVQLSVFNNNNNNSDTKMDSQQPSIIQRQAQRETRQRFVEWMEVLANGVAGWQDVKPNHDFVLLDDSSNNNNTSILPIQQQPHHGDSSGEVKTSSSSSNTVNGSSSSSSFDLQSFETQILVKNLMEKVQTAGPQDTEIIQQVIEDWKSISSSSLSSSQTMPAGRRSSTSLANLAGALVDYFIRIHDPESATLWLSRRLKHNNNNNNNMNTRYLKTRTSAIIALWVQTAATSYTPEAPWRAQDLLTQMERILLSERPQQQQNAEGSSSVVPAAVVDHRLYMAVANLWYTSSEPRGAQKAIQICLDHHPVASFHPELLNLAVEILTAQNASSKVDSSQQPPSSWEQTSIRKALALFEKHHDELNGDATLVSLIHGLEQALTRTIKSSESSSSSSELLRIARLGVNHGVMPSPKTCELLFSTLTEPDQVVNMVEKVHNAVAKPRIYLYAQAVNRLLGMQKNRGKQLKIIVGEMLLDRIANGTISLEDVDQDGSNNVANQLRDLLTQYTGILNHWKRLGDCRSTLEVAESILMTGIFEPSSLNGESLIPITCYTDLMQIQASRGRRNELLVTLQRLVKHYEAGYTSLLPNTSLFKLCMATVGSSSSQLLGKIKAAAVVVNVKEQEALLNQLIALYAATGKSPECKPTADLFDIILQEMKKSPSTPEDAVRAETLIDKMLSLDVEIENGTTCSLAFSILLSSRTERIFERSMIIYEKMKMAVAKTDKDPMIFEGNINFLFNLIRVCAHCDDHERHQALPIALKAFSQLHERGLANAEKYAFFVQTISKLIPHNDNASRRTRDALLERVFSMASRDGCLSPEVKSLFKKQLTHDQMNRLFQRHAADASSRETDKGKNPTRRKSQMHDTTTTTATNANTKVENGKHAHV